MAQWVGSQGPDGELPFMFSFGSADSFKWEVSDPSVLSLVSASGKDSPKASGSFGVRLRGLAVGRAEVRVHIKWHMPCCGPDCEVADTSCPPQTRSFTASASINVVDGLALEMPSVVTLPPNTKYQIQTNADESQQSAAEPFPKLFAGETCERFRQFLPFLNFRGA